MWTLDLNDHDEVIDTLRAGAKAMREASCRRGSIDFIESPGHLIATGDTHDHPKNFKAVLSAAGLDGEFGAEEKHLTLHEIIHGELPSNPGFPSIQAIAGSPASRHSKQSTPSWCTSCSRTTSSPRRWDQGS